MGAAYKRKRRSCGLCKPSKRGLAKRERKGRAPSGSRARMSAWRRNALSPKPPICTTTVSRS
jgi:hypothetical protein